MAVADPVRSKVSGADKVFGISTKSDSGKVRLRAGSQYLHWSGGFLTSDPDHAWVGTIDQAENCRRVFDAAAGCRVDDVSAAHNKNFQEE